MKRSFRQVLAVGVGIALTMGMVITANGAETRTPITSVSISVNANVELGQDTDETKVSIHSGSENYSVGDYEWISQPLIWEAGAVPKMKIYIYARSGYYFDKTTSSSKFNISGAEYSTSKRTEDNEVVELTVTLNRVKGDLNAPEGVSWSGNSIGQGEWEEVSGAGYYEAKLYRNGNVVKSIQQISNTYYNFYPYMTKKGTYTFKVRAVAKNSAQEKYLSNSSWSESDDQDILETEVSNGSGAPSGTPVQPGWQQEGSRWWYRNPDGSYQRDGWFMVNGKWYLFDSNGYMLTGWQTRNGRRYYMSASGDMQSGWIRDNNSWYYLGSGGDMQTGWVVLNNVYYHMDSNGVMQTGWINVNGYYYYMDPSSGAMARNQWIGSYYVNNDGVWVQ